MIPKNTYQTKIKANQLTLNYIEAWFKDFKNIIFNVNISFENIKRMKSPKDEFELTILNQGFFDHYYYLSIFSIIVQLCKIFSSSKNQRRSLNKLFKLVKENEFDSELNELLNRNKSKNGLFTTRQNIFDEIDLLADDIESHRDIITKVNIARDQYYTHSDPFPDIPTLTFSELELLIKLSIKIYNSLSGKILNETFMFGMVTDWNIDYPIRILALHEKTRVDKINKKLSLL